ncbi:C4-dicarboxylate ABC transporter [Leminorella grimontii]|uniref:C4-dicarboxylate ABC transporter n=2 Tax=Leminorella grimontii TaxID=82981 RepID=A0AAV5N5T7_9GAMM|nr:C4-dicarboxylate transporter DcuC [Leminorella grimontii]KFC97211.1 anaerobic C4-dicarboxylate transporter [Leminorella grimontii ATCC 33999 = DSM 5078]GKX56945.1 C4-dicarboxylate ABC transporter [Leminorella grimontii]GKX58937.1 C4-dicarboxylate ABC transporter [Leminorella grimontii]
MGLTISLVVIAWVAWMIARKGYATAVLLIAGVFLLGTSVLLDLGPGLTLKKSTGSGFFDIFQVVQNIMSSNLGGLGLAIMAMGGFSRYMDTLHAGQALYAVVGGPLKYIKSPYLLACMGFIVSQIIGMAIPSASGLALMLMVTLYPVMIRAGVSRLTAVAIIGSSRFFDLGPGSANCLLAAKTSGIEWAEYFLHWQMKIYFPLLLTMLVSHYFVQRFWERREGPDPEDLILQEQFRKEQEGQTAQVPKIYALLPIVPLVILLLFNPVVLGQFGVNIKVGVPSAIVLSTLIAMLFDFIRRRNGFDVLNGMKSFFEGLGKQLTIVVALIIAGQVFGEGLIAIGAVNSLIAGVEGAGLGAGFMIILMSLIIGAVAFLMGSGNAPFFSFAALIPSIAAKMGVPSAAMLLPLQTMTGFGRTMSPVTGAIVAVAGIAGVSPFQIVKRNAIQLVLCMLVNFILTFTVVLP